jgi:hypothetical protein
MAEEVSGKFCAAAVGGRGLSIAACDWLKAKITKKISNFVPECCSSELKIF